MIEHSPEYFRLRRKYDSMNQKLLIFDLHRDVTEQALIHKRRPTTVIVVDISRSVRSIESVVAI